MFKQNTVKKFAILAIVLSAVGLLISIGSIFIFPISPISGAFFIAIDTLLKSGGALFIFTTIPMPSSGAVLIGIATWGSLLWASIMGFQLCKWYTLDETEYRSVGILVHSILWDTEYKSVEIAVYSILIAFLIYFFFGIIGGLGVSIIITARVWALKSKYDDMDEWNDKIKRRSPKIVLTKNEESTTNEDNITA